MKNIFILILGLLWFSITNAQEKNILLAKDQLMFQHLGPSEGLMHNSITTVLQDSKGFIWFGTLNGLYKYDGYNFVFYVNSPDDEDSLLSNKVFTLYEDRNKEIWIGTKKGLCKFNRKENNFSSKNSIEGLFGAGLEISDPVHTILQDREGVLWVGSRFGLYSLVNVKGDFLVTLHISGIAENTLSSNHIRDIKEGHLGSIWVATNNGLNQILKKANGDFEFQRYFNEAGNDNSLISSTVNDIFVSSKNDLWIGTRKGLSVVRLGKGLDSIQFTNYLKHSNKEVNTISNNNINALTEDAKGNIWIGFRSGGINVLDATTGTFSNVNSSNSNTSLKSQDIHDLMIDASGVLWLATARGWVSKLDIGRKKIFHYKHKIKNSNSLSSNAINTIYEDSKNNLWVAVYGQGINRLYKENGTFSFVKYKQNKKQFKSFFSKNVFGIAEDDFGNYWTATQTDGLGHFKISKDLSSSSVQNIQYRYTKSENDFPSNKLAVITKDNKGDIWVGAYDTGGLIQFTPKDYGKGKPDFLSYKYDSKDQNTLSMNSVSCIYEDSEGLLWVGTNGGGVNKIIRDELNNPVKFIRIANIKKDLKSISNDHVHSITEDKNGNIWIGTFGGGLNKLSKKDKHNITPVFERFTTRDGLPSNEIYGVLEGEDHKLWISTNNGISIFDPATNTFSNLSTSDGLQAENFRKYAYFKGNDGTLYFGGINGLNVLDPKEIKVNQSLPKIEITGFKIFNKTVAVGEEVLGKVILTEVIGDSETITLNAKHNTFSFEFAALHYASPKENEYKYMLEGVDSEWISTTSDRRFAGYSNLKAGNYTFKVKASNNDNIWNENYKSIEVIILPPWWKTWWAYVLYATILFVLMFLFKRYVLINEVYQNKLNIEKLEQEKIKEINKMKLEFFTNVSHEFKTPLTLILGPLQTLINASTTSTKVKESLLLMERNANHLFRLINQIMEFRKLETKELKLELTKGDLVNFCKEQVFSFNVLAETKNIELQFQSGENSIEGYFDWDKMEKIINNLISNSIKYTPDGGEVKLALLLVDQQNEADAVVQSVRIVVSDNGDGIPKNQMDLIFDRFYQIKNESGTGAKGSGIGLALTKSLIEAHKGTIEVTSELKKGSNFSVQLPILTNLTSLGQPSNRLPLDQDEPLAMQTLVVDAENITEDIDSSGNDGVLSTIANESEAKEKVKPTLLIVEDNPDMLLFISNTLKDTYKIYKATDGVKGLKSALKHVPDIIISDVMMPNMDGIEFCDKLKSNEISSHIPIVLLTARASVEHRIEGLKVGADAYIPKPFDIRHLEVRIQTLLDQREKLKIKFSSGDIKLDSQKIGINKLEKDFLEKMETVVEENLSNSDFGVEDLGEAMGYSKMQLYRKLKSIRGLSANEFIREYRVKKAAVYLRETDMKIFEILYEIGISNHSYFTKCFKQHFEMSPREYIEKYRGQ